MRGKRLFWVMAVLMSVCFVTAIQGQVPPFINYQGFLTDDSDLPQPLDGTISIRFRIYNSLTGGSNLWQETQSVNVENGVFSVLLGTNSSDGIPLDLFDSSTQRFLELRVDGTTLTPRRQFASVPYAFTSRSTNGGIQQINGGNAITVTSPTGPTATVAVTNNSLNDSEIQDNSLTASSLAANSVGSSEIATNAVGSSEIASNAVGTSELQASVDFGSASVHGFVDTWNATSGRIVNTISGNTAGGGFVRVLTKNGGSAVLLSTRGNGTAGDVSVYNSSGAETCGLNGDTGVVFGSNFATIAAAQNRPGQFVRYSLIESPEPVISIRGKANLVSGRAFIDFPEHFSAMAVPSSITVTLTPRSADSKGLAAVEVSAEGIQVAELGGGAGGYTFDYVAYSARKGFEDYKVYINATEIQSYDRAAPIEK